MHLRMARANSHGPRARQLASRALPDFPAGLLRHITGSMKGAVFLKPMLEIYPLFQKPPAKSFDLGLHGASGRKTIEVVAEGDAKLSLLLGIETVPGASFSVVVLHGVCCSCSQSMAIGSRRSIPLARPRALLERLLVGMLHRESPLGEGTKH